MEDMEKHVEYFGRVHILCMAAVVLNLGVAVRKS